MRKILQIYPVSTFSGEWFCYSGGSKGIWFVPVVGWALVEYKAEDDHVYQEIEAIKFNSKVGGKFMVTSSGETDPQFCREEDKDAIAEKLGWPRLN